MSKNIAAEYKPFILFSPQTTAATAGLASSAVAITPGEEQDAVAVIQVGTIVGNPTSTTVSVTIAGSATSGGSYTTISTSATANVAVGTGQITTLRVIVNTGLYAFIKATAVVGFTGGTTPAVSLSGALLIKQTIATDSNQSAFA